MEYSIGLFLLIPIKAQILALRILAKHLEGQLLIDILTNMSFEFRHICLIF